MAELTVEVVKLIFKASKKIKKVLKTLDQNNEDIRNFEQFVESWSQILAPLEKNTAMLEDAGISTAVKYLWESVERAQAQILSDTGSNRVSLALKAEDKANKLRRLQQEISNKMNTVTGAMTAYCAASMTQICRPPSESELQRLKIRDTKIASARTNDAGHQEKALKFKDDIHNIPIQLFHEATRKFYDDVWLMKMKIHRYPPSIQDLGDWFTIPRIVAIGPYHHRRKELKHTEAVKHVAAYYCIKESGHSVQDMYDAVVSVVAEIDARSLYNNKDEMEGIIDNDSVFLPMMFYDACFLVMYMLKLSGKDCNKMLYDFFESNANDIDHDIMLLENQIPWPVVDAIIKYIAVPLEVFIANWNHGRLNDRDDEVATVVIDDSYEPPHILGLLRFYIVGKNRRTEVHGTGKMTSIATSVSAIELAKMGINLTAHKTTKLADMDLTNKPIFFAELSMAPLSLNDLRASLLVNMAALEQCTTPDFFDEQEEYEASAVCSYLLLLCMLMHREEDVHELRTKGILQGGAGLTNKTALDLFTSLQSLRMARCCARVMVQIESYRNKRAMRITLYAFIYSNWKIILGVISAISAFGSILGAIKSLKGAN